MTLVARPKPHGPTHKKRTGQHHKHSKHYFKPYLPYLPLMLVVGLGLLLNSAWPNKHTVLGYATDMSVQSLLDDTNVQRTNDHEAVLGLNSRLNSAAQAKANDMAARDYWSHNTPDGQTPWTFITAAGYSYQLAGENLAYGLDTASATITGWMNSAEHRANILNSGYMEVGFGIANSANYQGSGPETIVVAMYAKPASGVAVAAAPTSTPASTPVTQTTPDQTASGTSGGSAPNSASTPQPVKTSQPAGVSSPENSTVPSAIEPASRPVARVQLLTSGQAPWSVFAISLVSSVAILIFILRHGLYWRRVLVKGESFVMHHPLLDVAIVAVATLGIILTRSAGVIR